MSHTDDDMRPTTHDDTSHSDRPEAVRPRPAPYPTPRDTAGAGTAPAESTGTTGGSRPVRPRTVARALPAGHAILIIVGALLFAIVFNSHAMVHAGEGMKAGTTRDLVLGVAKPVDSFAHTLWLDRPRRWLDKLFGHEQAPTGPSALSRVPTKEDNRPLGAAATPKPAASGAPQGGPSAPPKPAAPALRVPTAAAPLKLLIAGDSMTEFMGPALVNQASAQHKADGNTITKYGTGLVRPDFFDWSIYAQQLVDEQKPEAVVVMMGGNDGQGITLANGQVLPDGTDAWAKEYRRRAEVVMRIFAGDGKRRVYWVSMPAPRSDKLAADYHLIDLGLADAAASVPGVKYVDISKRLSVNGQYSDYLPGANGQTILARARDGIHMSQDGASLAASLVLAQLNADWHLTG